MIRNSSLKKLFGDIRFWILLFLLIRLAGITNAPLEIGHNWRQSLTAMIGRNFLEIEANLLYPRIDMAGEKTGIIGSEFPIFNYLIYLFSELFGYEHWYGRLINLICSSLGVFYFYKLIRNMLNKEVAFNASIILLTSIWFAFSRKIMPDTFSIALMLAGLYYGLQYIQTGQGRQLWLAFILCTLGMLSKIPALSLFAVVGLVPFVNNVPVKRRVSALTVAGLSFALVCLWYFYWVPHLLDTYQYQLYFPKTLSEGLKEILPLWPELLEKFYFSALHSFIAFVLCLIGLVLILRSDQTWLKLGILFILPVFVLFVIKTGSIFPTHNYYVIPLVPLMAMCAGYALTRIPKKFQVVLLVLIAIEGIANQQHDFFIKDSEKYKLRLEPMLEEYIPKGKLIVLNGGPSPQLIYFAHQKGWNLPHEAINQAKLDSLSNLGAQFLVIDKHVGEFRGGGATLHEDDDFLIMQL